MHLHLSDQPQIEAPAAAPVPLSTRDAAMLAWLALQGPTARDHLAALLWPESGQAQARNTLRQRLFQLKRACGMELAAGSPVLTLAAGVTHDLSAASEVLGDLSLPDAPEIDAWLRAQRELRRARERDELREQASALEAAGDWVAALPVAQALLRQEPLSEEAHQRVMRLHYLAGDRASALAAFEACELVLKDELGARPGTSTLALLATVEKAASPVPAGTQRRLPASVLRPPRTVGRARERAELDEALAQGRVAALLGEAGMGKTRLLADRAHAQPTAVRAGARPGDAGVPFATLARLLRVLAARQGSAGAAPALRQSLARVLPEWADTGPASAARLPLHQALATWLRQEKDLPLLMLDDLHHADAASIETLGAVIEDLGDAPPGWLFALRADEGGAAWNALQAAWIEDARLTPVVLGPLSEPAVAELVDALGLEGCRGAELAPALHRRTGGNPLFVLETLRQAWVHPGAPGMPLNTPASVERLLDLRLTRLSAGALALARVAAVAGVDFDIALAESVLGTPAITLADAMNELEAAQVLRDGQFAHDLVFDAALRSVPPSIARHTHRGVALWLQAYGGEPARVAEHWLRAGDEGQALPWLARAAEQARGALRFVEALGFLDHQAAIEEQRGHFDAAFRTTAEAVRVGFGVDLHDAPAQARAERLTRVAHTASARAQAGLLLAETALRRRDIGTALQRAEAAWREAASLEDAALRAQSRALLAMVLGREGRHAEALEHALAASGWMEAHGDPSDLSPLLSCMGGLYFGLGRAREAVQQHERAVQLARKQGDMTDLPVLLINLANAQTASGDSAHALSTLDEAALLRSAQELGRAPMTGLEGSTRTAVLARLGRYALALATIEETRSLLAAHGQVQALHELAMAQGQVWAHLGQWARLQALLGDLPRPQRQPPFNGAREAWLQHELARSRGRAEPGPLAEALERLQGKSHFGLRELLLLLQAPLLAPAPALAQVLAVQAAMDRAGLRSLVMQAHAVAADLLRREDPRAAARHAHAAWELLADTDAGRGYRGEIWLHAARALHAAGEAAAAARAWDEGRAWVQDVAQRHVPAEFRDGFLLRNPVNRSLITGTPAG